MSEHLFVSSSFQKQLDGVSLVGQGGSVQERLTKQSIPGFYTDDLNVPDKTFQQLINEGYLYLNGGGIKLSSKGQNLEGALVVSSDVTSVPAEALARSNFTELILPDSITLIRDAAFFAMPKLKRLVFPSSVVLRYEEGGGIVSNCRYLEEVEMPSTISNSVMSGSYGAYGGYSHIEEDYETYTGNGPYIPQVMFSGCLKLKSIVIPEGIKLIDSRAFSCCYSLQSVTLPQSLIEIKSEAFAANPRDLRDFVGYITQEEVQLQNVVIPGNVRYVSGDAFIGWKHVTVVDENHLRYYTGLGESGKNMPSAPPFGADSYD